jgi:hypothetical protein
VNGWSRIALQPRRANVPISSIKYVGEASSASIHGDFLAGLSTSALCNSVTACAS